MKHFSLENMKHASLAALLMASALFTACSGSDDITSEPTGAKADSKELYTMTVEATKAVDNATTRALTLDGKALNTHWNAGEEVQVLQEYPGQGLWGYLGTLTAAASSNGTTTLSGTLTNDPNETGNLRFVLHGRLGEEYGRTVVNSVFTGQTGVLLKSQGENSIEENFDYALCELTNGFTIDTANKTVSVPAGISLKSQQAIVKFTLVDKNGDPINATSLTYDASPINSASSVHNYKDGIAFDEEPTEVTGPSTGTSVFYVAIFAPIPKEDTITLTATDVDGNIYTYTKSNFFFLNGKYYEVTVTMRIGHEMEVSSDNVSYTTDTQQHIWN